MVAAIQHNYKISAFKGKWVHLKLSVLAENITCAFQSKYMYKYTVGYSMQLTNSCVVDTCLSWNRASLSLLFSLAGTGLLFLTTLVMCYFTEFRGKMVSSHDWYGNVDTLEPYFDSVPCGIVLLNKIRNILGKKTITVVNIW